MNAERISYLLNSFKKTVRGVCFRCPSCGSDSSSKLTRKYLVTQLRRCDSCHILFRTPTSDANESRVFYQSRYQEGFTTDMPDDDELRGLIRAGFKNTNRDYSRYIDLLDNLCVPRTASVLDFGCSWGYGSWQFARAGYSVQSVEVSEPRGRYAREKLNCNVFSGLNEVKGHFDVFFSSHVLEHVPSVGAVIKRARQIIKPGGYFVAFTPNGSMAYRQCNPTHWEKLWGMVHPNFLDNEFYERQFSEYPFLITSDSLGRDAVAEWVGRRDQRTLDVAGCELLVVVKM